MLTFGAVWRSHAVRDSLLLMFISTFARALSALGAVVVAYAAGTGHAMDRYMAFNLATVSMCVLVSIAVPSIASSVIAQGGVLLTSARATVRRWGVVLSNAGAVLFLGLVPLMAWLFTPDKAVGLQAAVPLGQLLLIGTASVWIAPRLAAEQTLLQGLGYGKRATAYSAACSGAMLFACGLTAASGNIFCAALGLPIGAALEYVLLKRKLREVAAKLPVTFPVPGTAKPPTELPWKAYAVFTGASLSAFVIGLIDQALLAEIGDNAQALWGLAGRPASFLATTLFTVVATLGTVLAVKSDLKDLTSFTERTFKLAFGATLAIGTLLLTIGLFSEPLVRFLYERGGFLPADTERTAAVVPVALWTYVLYPAGIVFVRALSTLHRYRPLLWSTAAFLVVKLGLGVALLPWGLPAVALSTFAAMLCQAAILAWSLKAAQRKQALEISRACK